LAVFAPVLAQPGGLIYPPRGGFTDLTVTHWPNIEFALESLRANGRLPLWRPTIMSGAPFAANPLSGLHYPPHVIFLVVPLAIGFNVLFIAHVWLAGCGAYALLRAWQVERLAAFVGAVTWMATPKLFAHLGAGHVGMVEAVAWMPWAALAAHRLIESQRAMNAAWLGAVWAIQFLADPRISFYTVALTATYVLVEVIATAPVVVAGDPSASLRAGAKQSPAAIVEIASSQKTLLAMTRVEQLRRGDIKTGCLGVLLAIVTFAILSAALWLPLAEFVTQSNRATLTLAEAGEWSLPPRQLASLFLADWGGFHEWTVYLGILPLVLAAYAVRCVIRDRAPRARAVQHVWLITSLLVAALFSLGTHGPLFPLLFRFVPGLSFLRVPPRAWFIVAFAAACLCAFGVEAMMRSVRKPRWWVTPTGVALSSFALMFGLGGFFLLRSNAQAALARAALLHLALVIPTSLAVVLLRWHGRISPRGFAVGSAVVIAATLAPVDWSLYRVTPEAQAFSDHADVAAWLAKQPGSFRVYSPSYSLPQHVAQRAGLELAEGVDPMQLASYARLMQAATGARASGYSVTIPAFPPNSNVATALRDARPDARLLGKLDVRYVAAEFPIQAEGLIERERVGSTFVYENQFALPRAFVGDTAADIVIQTPDRVIVKADGPGALTLSQVYYPGWQATVDGRPVAISVVDSLMSVSLDAGQHAIEFVFDPWTVKVGVMVSVAGWGGLVVIGLVSRWRRKTVDRWNRATM
jgi:hypothetical protein